MKNFKELLTKLGTTYMKNSMHVCMYVCNNETQGITICILKLI